MATCFPFIVCYGPVCWLSLLNYRIFTSTYYICRLTCVAFSPDFEMMVTGCDDQRVRVFNSVTGKLVVKLNGHSGIYLKSSFNVEKKTASHKFCCLCGESNYSIMYFTSEKLRTVTKKKFGKLCVVAGSIRAVAISADSKYFASASYDKTIRVCGAQEMLIPCMFWRVCTFLYIGSDSFYPPRGGTGSRPQSGAAQLFQASSLT